MKIIDRYASSIRSSNLKSKPETAYSDTDVLGAIGIAGKRHPLAVALTRLYCGDNHASNEIVRILSETVWGKSATMPQSKPLRRAQADDMAKAVLAWYRDGTCKTCGGHGFKIACNGKIGSGRAVLGDSPCDNCKGAGKIPFERKFTADRVSLARWLLAEIEREQSAAGPEAMKMLADRLHGL